MFLNTLPCCSYILLAALAGVTTTTARPHSLFTDNPTVLSRSNSAVQQIHIATVNVKNSNIAKQTASDYIWGEKSWDDRKTRLADALLSTGPLDIWGAQEVLSAQLSDLAWLFGSDYGHVGVGRDDGKEAGEFSPIFYNSTKFDVVRWNTTWLSTTPDVPGSVGWDASLTRIATLLTLRYRDGDQEGKLVHAFNTHYDDQGVEARANSSLLLRATIKQWVDDVEQDENAGGDAPVVFFGDFNSPPEEDGYQNMVSLSPLPSGNASFTFLDTYTHLLTSTSNSSLSSTYGPLQTRPYGPAHTYTGFEAPGYNMTKRIDFILLGAELEEAQQGGGWGARGGWEVSRFGVVENYVEGDVDGFNARWSDHRAVRATIAKQTSS
ncbi:endonuclease/exonuclease/phosphatase [Cryptococcus wingfieldii CBS 7118]|uniref:Endonuclease/exonuclease/phosphatase n=1 Tax=Cryptococcus wingfieldii CBS 7118 TaxID=1295528 RepID=A0A1E3ID87_9TREE|nr:endonuclease/exonuclease/phosphatase [Cryptococcus wingfieldii CBS 7118]ODN86564.1 endonuclease/exonuclease/phosphatase [Cryptococcus wingfieldii CBS 7118]